MIDEKKINLLNEEAQKIKLMEMTDIREPTIEEKIRIFVESFKVDTSNVEQDGKVCLPPKLGYKWQMMFNGNSFVWELVKDENAIGTSRKNAIIYYDGCPLILNAWYTDGESYYVCINNTDIPEGIEDRNIFEPFD